MSALIEAQRYARPCVTKLLGMRYRNDVDDVLQQAAINALRHAGDFRGDAQFRVWFTSIAKNAALMHLRANKRRHMVSIDGEAAWLAAQWESVGPSPERQAAQQELADEMNACIGELSDVLKVEALGWLGGESTGVNGTRKARRFRAKRELRAMLEGRWRHTMERSHDLPL